MTDRLREKVEKLRGYRMTPKEVAEQRVSFAYGNAPIRDCSTKEQVREDINSVMAPAD